MIYSLLIVRKRNVLNFGVGKGFWFITDLLDVQTPFVVFMIPNNIKKPNVQ